MTWGIGSWPPLTKREHKAFITAVWGLYALLIPVKPDEPRLRRDDIRIELKCDDPEDLLQVARFRHAGAMMRTAPDLVWTLTGEVPAWRQLYVESLEWGFSALGRDSKVHVPQDGQEWEELAQNPKQWARYAHTALFRRKSWRLRNAKVTRAYHGFSPVCVHMCHVRSRKSSKARIYASYAKRALPKLKGGFCMPSRSTIIKASLVERSQETLAFAALNNISPLSG